MNIIFISLLDFRSVNEHNIYADLLREFRNHGHDIYIVSPSERREIPRTVVLQEEKVKILKIKTGNIQKTNYVEKAVSLMCLHKQLIWNIREKFKHIRFDLVLCATPPVTIYEAVKYLKMRDHAGVYLLLKDIWPQSMADLGVISADGLICRYFRKKERSMYLISDYIGCMSQKNVDYLRRHHKELDQAHVEVCPNCMEPLPVSRISQQDKAALKQKYKIPLRKYIFLYGGNLGRPQGLDFFLHVIRKCMDPDIFFLIIGDGTEYGRVHKAVQNMDPEKVRLIRMLPEEEYRRLTQISDAGLIFLNPCFTVPNIPSRILSYMQASLPVLAATDESTDLKTIIRQAEMGYWCRSGDTRTFLSLIQRLKDAALRERLGKNGRVYLENHYHVKYAYRTIISHFIS